MTAKTATERKREERARKKMSEEDRLARLLARTIKLDLYKSTDMALIRCMVRAGVEEPQDMLTRLIHGAGRLDDAALEELVRLPSRHGVTNE